MANKKISELNQVPTAEILAAGLFAFHRDGVQTYKMTFSQLFDAIQGGGAAARTVTGSTTLTDDDTVILFNTTSGIIGQALPAAATLRTGKVLILKNIGVAGNNLTITPDGSEKIDNLASVVLAGDSDVSDQVKLRNTGTGWQII